MGEVATDLLVRRDDLRSSHFVATPLPELAEGEALLRVDSFALTATTVTYAAVGDDMRYWDFFPCSEPGWGRVPCWGHGEVVASRAAELEPGTRVFGYFPIGTHLVVVPGAVRAGAFIDHAVHRRALPSFYNSYRRARGDADAEAMNMLLRLLFSTAWVIDAFLADAECFGARRIALSSASSKTAMGLAWCLKRRGRVETIGLTSSGNAAFVEGLGCYDRVIPYDRIDALSADGEIVYADFAGSAPLRRAVHAHFRRSLVYDCAVGATDWSAIGPWEPDLPGAAPHYFFAPKHMARRAAEWGHDNYAARLDADFTAFEVDARRWLTIVRASGPEAVGRYWLSAVEGRLSPAEGLILRV
ncbi:DUF2855 family protein [Chelatococcus reniformis]|uniref:DUF2855 domain-containing protein n=1 Tax=Chelatococcus reniformis TaxID=1494448 RepID=A0A916UQ33_9HYPH|nr:DUF2855 family protein [Chelatococcus reniformis]GGC82810.1 hypothetical protein GCM10010994_45900 [Chelatococcus reniformis]